MANKSNKKCSALGVKMAAPAAIMVATTKAVSKAEEDLKALVARLQVELDAERRTTRQQRRDHEVEVQKVRNEEQCKSSIALKELTKKNLEEKQRDLELQRETMRVKCESDSGKIVKLKDREISKLRGDLAKCQDELREELSKRGLSTAARATFDSERQKLLQEVRDLQIAKRHLEERLEKASETEKRLQLEMRRVQETSKLELTRVEREAKLEVKKLLEELKNKDHMLEMMDRAIHPDRSTLLKSRLDRLTIEDILSMSRNMGTWSTGVDSSNKTRYTTHITSCTRSNSINSDKVLCKYNDISDKSQCKCANKYEHKTENQFENSDCHSNNSEINQQRSSGIDYIRADHECKVCRCGNRAANVRNVSRKPSVITKRSVSICSKTSRDTSKVRSRSTGSIGRNRDIKSNIPKSIHRNVKNNDNKKSKISIIRNNSNECNLQTVNENKEQVKDESEVSNQDVTNDEEKNTSETGQNQDQKMIHAHCILQRASLQRKLDEREKVIERSESEHRAVIERNKKLFTDNKQQENKIKNLHQQIKNLKKEHESSQKEIHKLNEIITNREVSDLDTGSRSEDEGFKQRCSELEQVLTSLRHDCQEKDRRIGLLIKSQQKYKHKYEPKTVRFSLPDDHQDDDDNSESLEDSKSSTSSSCSDPIECDELLIQSVHKDFETLLVEHMKLQKYCASLLQAKSNNSCNENQELHAKRDSLSITISAMEEKLKEGELREQKLKQKVKELSEQNEEMEFRILELEEFNDKNIFVSCMEDSDAMSQIRQLQDEVSRLTCRLAQYECLDLQQLENDVICTGVPVELTQLPDPQHLSVENLRKLRESLTDSDEENPDMAQSFSTMTSGFDEISCISLELDDRTEMPDLTQEEEDLERDADDIPSEMPSEEADVEEHGGFSGCDVLVSGDGLDGCSDETNDSMINYECGQLMEDILSLICDEVDASEMAMSDENGLLKVVQLESNKSTACITAEHDNNIPSLIESSQHVENESSQSELNEPEKIQRIKDLQNEVDVLQKFDEKYSSTIQTLNELESRLNQILPVSTEKAEAPEDSRPVPIENDESADSSSCKEVFWAKAKKEVENNMAVIQREIDGLNVEDCEETACDEQIESYTLLSRCADTLQNTNIILNNENQTCQQLDSRIECLERELSSEDHYSSLDECFTSCEDLQEAADQYQPTEDNEASVDAGILGSLKRLALDVVAAGFRTDVLELKSLTQDFFAATVDDELNDFAFIDEDESACVQGETCTEDEIESLPSKLNERNELRLNTKLTSLHQRFDFLSPTSFDNPDWSNSSHLETVNHCLLQQIEELEKERDSLKDIVYRDDGVINEMTQQISQLQNSEQELKQIVCTLEATEEQFSEQICRLESHCQTLQGKLARAESVEAGLRRELEERGRGEVEMEARLLKSVDTLGQTAARLRANLSEVEREKEEAEKRSEELSIVVGSLRDKESSLIKRMKSLENLHGCLTEKATDLETTLTSAYDEVTTLTKQKDTLTQRLNSISDENRFLRRDNDDLSSERKTLRVEVDKLTESENFLKEANRKLWLSLQANIEEREQILSRKCTQCTEVEKSGGEICSKATVLGTEYREISVQTEEYNSEHKLSVQKTPVTQGSLSQSLSRLIHTCPNILLLFSVYISNLSARTKHGEQSSQSSVTEKKAIFEEMLKFISSARRASSEKGSERDLVDDVLDMGEVEGEEEWWGVVENYDDINDVRAADTWGMWRQLEIDIMKVNIEDLRTTLGEREANKSCQTIDQETSGVTTRSGVGVPPLPKTTPPNKADDAMEQKSTQTDRAAPSSDTFSETSTEINTLRHLLNANERTLSAQKNEVDRLTVEMRSWQQRALQADSEVTRLTTELSTALSETRGRTVSPFKQHSSISDSKHVSTDLTRSRIEPHNSQIPVSVRRAVDFYSAIDQGAGTTLPGYSHVQPMKPSTRPPRLSPRGSRSLSTEAAVARLEEQLAQGPASNGSSISDNQEQPVQPSHIPRLVPDWIQQQQQHLRQQQQQQQQLSGAGSVLDVMTHQAVSSRSYESLPVMTSEQTTSSVSDLSADVETALPSSHKTSRDENNF